MESFIVIVIGVSLLSGFLSGAIGFASGILPAALLSLVLPPTAAMPLLAPIVFASALLALPFHWRMWSTRHILLTTPPLVLGTYLGTSFLATAPERLIDVTVAGLVVIVAVQELTGRPARRETGPTRLQRATGSVIGGLLAGLLAGVASALAHAGGVVIAAYLLGAGVRPSRFTGTVLAVLVLADAAKLATYLQAGLFAPAMAGPVAWALPFLLAGVYVGRQGHRRIPTALFRSVVASTLLGIALLMVSSAWG